MAYLKYKEITKYFYFYKKLDNEHLSKYVLDYVDKDENILSVYATKRDKGVFTDKKILLFDVTPFSKTKQIHIIPLKSISTIAILFKGGALVIYLDSGYPLNLKFRNLKPEEKTNLRLIYSKISSIIKNMN